MNALCRQLSGTHLLPLHFKAQEVFITNQYLYFCNEFKGALHSYMYEICISIRNIKWPLTSCTVEGGGARLVVPLLLWRRILGTAVNSASHAVFCSAAAVTDIRCIVHSKVDGFVWRDRLGRRCPCITLPYHYRREGDDQGDAQNDGWEQSLWIKKQTFVVKNANDHSNICLN